MLNCWKILSVMFAFALIATSRQASADAYNKDDPLYARVRTCTFTHPVRIIDSSTDIPMPIRNALGPEDLPAGFVRAGQFGDLYFVWYAIEGRVSNAEISVYRSKVKDNAFVLVARRQSSRPGSICLLTDELLDGNPSPNR